MADGRRDREEDGTISSGAADETKKINAEWTDDCSGKKDYDATVLRITTRYWPRGGGFYVGDPASSVPFELSDDPAIKPSASASLVLESADGESTDLVEADFEGESFEEVAPQVEKWAADQYARVLDALNRAGFTVYP